MMNRRAQVSIEFLVVASVILLLFVIMGYVINQKMRQAYDIKLDVEGQSVANDIAAVINQVVSVGDGFSQKLVLPADVMDTGVYHVRFYADDPTVYVEAGGMTWSAPLYTTNVSCAIDECIYDIPHWFPPTYVHCNKTTDDICLEVNRSTQLEVEVSNRFGDIGIGYPFELRQGDYRWQVHPFRGSKEPYVDAVSGCLVDPAGLPSDTGFLTYLYEDTDDHAVYLVLRVFNMTSTSNENVIVSFHNVDPWLGNGVAYASEPRNISDAFILADPQGNGPGCWELYGDDNTVICGWSSDAVIGNPANQCEGAYFAFNASWAYICITPLETYDPGTGLPLWADTNWYWVNADGERILLSHSGQIPVCITYP